MYKQPRELISFCQWSTYMNSDYLLGRSLIIIQYTVTRTHILNMHNQHIHKQRFVVRWQMSLLRVSSKLSSTLTYCKHTQTHSEREDNMVIVHFSVQGSQLTPQAEAPLRSKTQCHHTLIHTHTHTHTHTHNTIIIAHKSEKASAAHPPHVHPAVCTETLSQTQMHDTVHSFGSLCARLH